MSSEIASMEKAFERHTKEDRENFQELFKILRQNGEDTAVLIRRADDAEKARGEDKREIMTAIGSLNDKVGNINIRNAESKGVFDTLKMPLVAIVGSIIGGWVGKFWK